MIGRTLATYRILHQLGQGGMGAVYEAEDTRLGRRVALKVVPEELAARDGARGRFEREARTVAALNHPNIVSIYSFEEAEGIHFITMELVRGKTLSEAVPEDGMDLDDFFRLAIPLADALSAAGDKGIVHRDLKPGNLMVDESGQIKILDFGLAKMTGPDSAPSQLSSEELTGQGQILGTVPYMSPEQLQGEQLDPRSDVFSLGIVLYQMATGRHPFDADSSAHQISAILRDEPPSLSEIKVDSPRHLSRILEHCLRKDPERRFQTAKDVRNELEELRRESQRAELLAEAQTVIRPSASAASSPSGEGGAPSRSPTGKLMAIAGMMIIIAFAAWWTSSRGGEGEPYLAGVAVLPFQNQLGDPGEDYLAAGVSSSLISQLSRIRGVQVVGQQETWAVAGPEVAATRVAAELGVGTLVEGEVSGGDKELTIDMRVVDGASGVVLWSSRVDGDRDAIFDLEQRLASDLAEFLAIPMTLSERRRLTRDPTRSIRAYDYYLKAQRHLAERPQSPEFAIENFRQAVRLDDSFALAWVGLSESLQRHYEEEDRSSETLGEAEIAADRALELDPDMPEALVNLARLERAVGLTDASMTRLEEALERHPKPDEAYRQLAYTQKQAGDYEAARRSMESAVILEPERWSNWNALGSILVDMGEYDEAREAFEKAAQRAPEGFTWPQENLASLELYAGNFEAAVRAYERIRAPVDSDLASNRGTAYYYVGRYDDAAEYYRLAVELGPRDHVNRRNLADLLLARGEAAAAREQYLEARRLAREELDDRPGDLSLSLAEIFYSARVGDCPAALTAADALATRLPPAAESSHELAQAYAVCDAPGRAMDHLEEAVEEGYSFPLIEDEAEFESLRESARYRALAAAIRSRES